MFEFIRAFGVTRQSTVLDVGGTTFNWSLLPRELLPRVTLLNITSPPPGLGPGVQWIQASALNIPVAPGDFDFVFSNSVIEHLENWEAQNQFAAEVMRLRAPYWIQTPNKYFPIEPHFIGLGVQFVPARYRRLYVRYGSLRGLLDRGKDSLYEILTELRLLSAQELRILFPDGVIRRERLLGLTKSLIAVRRNY